MSKNSKDLMRTLRLPHFIVETLKFYEKEGYIDRNSFIQNSIRNHAMYCESYSDFAQTETTPIKVKLPNSIYQQLIKLAREHQSSVSEIVATTLSFSIANIIDELNRR